MKQSNIAIFYKALILFFSLTFFFTIKTYAQDEDKKVDSTQVVSKAIPIGDISNETEKLGQRIIKLRKILKPSTQIKEVDSLLNLVSVEIIERRDSLIPQLENSTRRFLKARKVEWDNYRTILKDHQEILKNRTEEVSQIANDLFKEIKKWEQTKKVITASNKSSDIFKGLDEAITALQEVLKVAQNRLDKIFVVQKGLTELVLLVDETAGEIDHVELQMQKDYFVIDSRPLWKSGNISNKTIDSTKTEYLSATNLILNGLVENNKELNSFFSLNIKTLVFQIIFILFLLVLILMVNKKWKINLIELKNPIEIQAKIVLNHPISATIVSGVLISAFFYDALIPAFSEIHVFLILIATVYLLPLLTNKSLRLFLSLIFFVYLLHTFEAYLGPQGDLVRLLIIVDAIILIVALLLGRNSMKRSPEKFEPIYKLFKVVSPIYILFLTLAIIANIIGMVSLSGFLVTGVLLSTTLGLVVYLVVKVIISLVIIFLKFRKPYSIQTLSTMVNVTHKRIQPVLNWVGLLIWLMFTFKGFDLMDFIVNWFNELMIIHWEIGQMTISLGGILAFIGIFISALIIAKVAASVFQDEWMVKVLPRGVAPAISLLLRIIVIGIGLYMALSAAGINLSSLGFMLGALGVGIGFGLQNVVLNFVAGLILAFERPINLGDTIEVDQEFGVVTNIGVRSSNIKSYSGYEAIIPNGDLISKKVINYTLANRNRRSKIQMKTAPSADPEKVIELFNKMAAEDPRTHKDPAPKTYFYGYDPEGSLSFALYYWTTFSDTLKTDSAIALKIFATLKEEGIQPPAPVRRIIQEK
jgi:small-conductance mechanosensitive channel